jgi:hypothetical protein
MITIAVAARGLMGEHARISPGRARRLSEHVAVDAVRREGEQSRDRIE